MCYSHEHVLDRYISQSLVADGFVKGIGVPLEIARMCSVLSNVRGTTSKVIGVFLCLFMH